MRSRDGSLVFLTILSQASIGMVWSLTALVHFSEGGSVSVGRGSSAEFLLFLALILIGVATASSFLHLGNPANAPKALRNLAGSWLSREILAIGAFAFTLVLALVSARAGFTGTVFNGLLLLASLAGLFLLLAMTRIYLVPTIPAWDNRYTPVSFTATTLSLGVMGALLLLEMESSGARLFIAALFVILVAELLSGFLNHRRLAGMDSGFDGPAFNRGGYYRLYLARMAILFIACVAVLFFLLPDASSTEGIFAWIYPVCVLVVFQEFAGSQHVE